MEQAIFMIEGGVALKLVQKHIADVLRVRKENRNLAEELGVTNVLLDNFHGYITGVQFPSGKSHPEFKKPNRWGVSYPKKGTEWAKRFDEQAGYDNPVNVIAQAFNVPLSVSYKTATGEGWSAIGNPFNECGFLYLSKDGPYAMWVPDVPAIVTRRTACGETIEEPAASFRLEFDGCRQIEREEWEILVCQHKLEVLMLPHGLKISDQFKKYVQHRLQCECVQIVGAYTPYSSAQDYELNTDNFIANPTNPAFEIVLDGFNGGTDETDDLVIWVTAIDQAYVEALLATFKIKSKCKALPTDIDVVDLIDFRLPKDERALLERIGELMKGNNSGQTA